MMVESGARALAESAQLLEAGRKREARGLLRDFIDEHPGWAFENLTSIQVATTYGYLLFDAGDYEGSLKYNCRAFDSLSERRGRNDQYTIDVGHYVVRCYAKLKRIDEALALQKQLVDAETSVYGGASHQRIMSLSDVGLFRRLQRNDGEALAADLVALDEGRRSEDLDPRSRAVLIQRLSEDYVRLKNHREAFELITEGLRYSEQTLGRHDPLTKTFRRGYRVLWLSHRLARRKGDQDGAQTKSV